MSDAPAFLPPTAVPPPGGFDLTIQPDSNRWCHCLWRLGQEIYRVEKHYRDIRREESAATWLTDFREDMRILFGTLWSDDRTIHNNMLARVGEKFAVYDSWRRGLGPAPWDV